MIVEKSFKYLQILIVSAFSLLVVLRSYKFLLLPVIEIRKR